MQKNLFLVSFALALSGCVTIPNTTSCTVAGVLSAGMNCAESQTDRTYELTLDETIEFLEPQLERPDPNNPGVTLPARAGAICQSADDFSRGMDALEQSCRLLGKKCRYEFKQAIAQLRRAQQLSQVN